MNFLSKKIPSINCHVGIMNISIHLSMNKINAPERIWMTFMFKFLTGCFIPTDPIEFPQCKLCHRISLAKTNIYEISLMSRICSMEHLFVWQLKPPSFRLLYVSFKIFIFFFHKLTIYGFLWIDFLFLFFSFLAQQFKSTIIFPAYFPLTLNASYFNYLTSIHNFSSI